MFEVRFGMTLQKLRQFFKDKLPLLLGVFIVLQPVLDILTAIGISMGSPVTAGVVVRSLFMGLTFLYVVFLCKFPGKKWCLAALGVLLAYLAVFMLHMLSVGGLALCLSNLQETTKTFFTPFVAVFLYAIYKEYGHYVSTRSIAWACGIYVGVILLAYLTGTSNFSYPNAAQGYNGWFYAANEISGIVAITSPVLMYYCFRTLPNVTRKTWWKAVLIVWTLAAVVFAAEFLGTKSIYAVVLVYIAAALIWTVIRMIREPDRRDLIQLLGLGVMLAALIALYFYSALRDHIVYVVSPLIDVPADELDQHLNTEIVKVTEGTWLRELINNNALVQRIDQVLSRRLLIAAPSVEVFLDGGLSAKLLGIGYANAASYGYSIESMIEIDPLAILIRHGILGFCIYIGPYVAFVVGIIVRFFRHPLQRLASLKYCSYLYACLVAFVSVVLVGHALVSPAMSIFLLVTAMQIWVLSGHPDPETLPVEQ